MTLPSCAAPESSVSQVQASSIGQAATVREMAEIPQPLSGAHRGLEALMIEQQSAPTGVVDGSEDARVVREGAESGWVGIDLSALPPYLLRNPTTTTSPRLPLLLSLLALLLPLVVFLATLLVFIRALRQSSAASFAPTIPLNPTSDPQAQQPAFLNAGPDFVHLFFVLGLICEISLVFVGGREVYRYWRRRYLRERPDELGEGRVYDPQGAIKTLERFLCLSPREILPPRPSRCTMVQVGEADEEYGSIERALREGAAPGYGSREMRSSTLVLWGPKLGEQERSEEMERAERGGREIERGGIV